MKIESEELGPKDRSGWRYELQIVQEPNRAPASGTSLNSLCRLPIIPAPVIRLIVRDQEGKELTPAELMNDASSYCCSVRLYSARTGEPVYYVYTDRQEERHSLIGSTVATLRRITDLQNKDVLYFVFGDVSVRLPGRFKLKFTLAEMTSGLGPVLASIMSEPFYVVEHMDYVGGYELAGTPLSHHLLETSGVKMYFPPLDDLSLSSYRVL